MQRKKLYGLLYIILMLALCLCSCGKDATVSEESSPRLVNAVITAFHEGEENQQYVNVILTFDKEVSLNEKRKDDLHITISDERVDAEQYDMELTGVKELQISIPVTAVTKAELKIEKSDQAKNINAILSSDGQYGAWDFTLEGIIDSGVSLTKVDSGEGWALMNVESVFQIRSMLWLGILDDGELIAAHPSLASEERQGYVAIHGHEFLTEDAYAIAADMAEVLQDAYGDKYAFAPEKSQIKVTSADGRGDLEIVICKDIYIDGVRNNHTDDDAAETADTGDDATEIAGTGDDTTVAAEEDTAGENHTGMKDKISEENRIPTEEEEAYLQGLTRASVDGTNTPYEVSHRLFQTLTLTGDLLGEEEVYSLYELEELIRLSFVNEKMNGLSLVDLSAEEPTLDFTKFLSLCGVDWQQEHVFLHHDSDQTLLDLKEWYGEGAAMKLVLSGEEGDSPFMLVFSRGKEEKAIRNFRKLMLSGDAAAADPDYLYHNRGVYLECADKTITFAVYRKGSEYLGAIKSASYSETDLERLMSQNPQAVVGGYYGTIGGKDSYQYEGLGGYLDYFKGLSLEWILKEELGLEDLKGSAELVGRDGEVFAQVEDLSYFASQGRSQDYYVLHASGIPIPDMVPMIAPTKNGYPLLPEHDHESEGYIPYNHLSSALEEMGIDTEVGVVKNHSGPFIACLGNLEGSYGGTMQETGGDCVQISIYLDN